MCHWIGSESESAVCRWGRYIRWRSFLPYEIRKARASRAGRKRERESDKEVGRRKRKAMKEGGIEGVVGQWSVNHRHGVMTRLSFQRLHRRKSSVRSYRPLSLSLSLPCPPSLLVPEHPLPERTTAWFLLQESIRWLQESKGFYVKILQKIMARYTFLQRGIALHSLSSRSIPLSLSLSSFFLHRPPFFVLTSRFFLLIFFARLPSSPSTELLCTESASL